MQAQPSAMKLQGSHLDPNEPPPPEQCPDCRQPLPWWWLRRPRGGRWMRPPGVCKPCQGLREQAEARRLVGSAQAQAGVPELHRLYRLEVVDDLGGRPASAHQWRAWRQRVLESRPPRIGVHPGNRAAYQAVKALADAGGQGEGIWLWGEVGCGKTLLASALCTALCQPKGLEWRDLPPPKGGWPEATVKLGRHRTAYRPKRLRPLFITEEDLLERTRLSWAGDANPLGRIAKAQVLVVDDMGAATPTAQWALDAIARMVDKRYRAGLPLVCTSNAPPSDLGDVLGRRTASRLQALCPTVVRVQSDDWRAA